MRVVDNWYIGKKSGEFSAPPFSLVVGFIPVVYHIHHVRHALPRDYLKRLNDAEVFVPVVVCIILIASFVKHKPKTLLEACEFEDSVEVDGVGVFHDAAFRVLQKPYCFLLDAILLLPFG